MSMEPRVVRTLKRADDDEQSLGEAERRKQLSDEILEIIYAKIVAKHSRELDEDTGEDDVSLSSGIGRGISALIREDE